MEKFLLNTKSDVYFSNSILLFPIPKSYKRNAFAQANQFEWKKDFGDLCVILYFICVFLF